MIIKQGNKSVTKSRKLSDSELVTQLLEMCGVDVFFISVIVAGQCRCTCRVFIDFDSFLFEVSYFLKII